MDAFLAVEDRDGARFSWNLWPTTSVQAKQLVVPIACIYSPLKQSLDIPMVNYDPIACPNCSSLLNPYCDVDFGRKDWGCQFCFRRTKLPNFYDGISPTSLPAELHPESTTIEYALSSGASALSPAFIFVVDISISADNLQDLKSALLELMAHVPENSYVGLVTFGSTVNVYELSFQFCPKVHVFDGNKEYSAIEVQTILGLGATGTASSGPRPLAHSNNKYIIPLSQTDLHLTSILEDLSRDPRPHKSDERPLRCTGTALKIALSMLEFTIPLSAARVLVFSGGPATYGPGMVLGTPHKEQMRSWSEINKETAPYIHKASKYYLTLAEQAVRNSHAVDVFSCSLNQIGLLEMQELFKGTGGCVITAESFKHEMFVGSLKKLFAKDGKGYLQMGFNCKIELKTSREIAVSGAIGHVATARHKSGAVSETPIGIGGTTEWKTAVMDPNTAIAFYFDINNTKSGETFGGQYGLVQFKTTYTHPSGQKVMRCTTVAHNWLPSGIGEAGGVGCETVLSGFDQEAAACISARWVAWKAQTEDVDMQKWLDGHLIRFCRQFANYTPNAEHTLLFPPAIQLYPTFMFHLRRGPFVNVFGCSPDETVCYRYYLMKECTANMLTMIQPALDQYTFDNEEPIPVLLSWASLKDDVLLLLDTFFHVIVWSGPTIEKWKKANYHLHEDYENLRLLMEAPLVDARALRKDRFPNPNYVETWRTESQERFLLAVLDPEPGAEGLHSEDASLARFMDHLKKFVVKRD